MLDQETQALDQETKLLEQETQVLGKATQVHEQELQVLEIFGSLQVLTQDVSVAHDIQGQESQESHALE